ncbi:MAG: hypothetical protein ABI443_00015 [Chthoniobacterales bacterium]
MKTPTRKSKKTAYNLGDLVAAIGSYAKNSRESLATLVDLLESGQVKFLNHGKLQRVHVKVGR